MLSRTISRLPPSPQQLVVPLCLGVTQVALANSTAYMERIRAASRSRGREHSKDPLGVPTDFVKRAQKTAVRRVKQRQAQTAVQEETRPDGLDSKVGVWILDDEWLDERLEVIHQQARVFHAQDLKCWHSRAGESRTMESKDEEQGARMEHGREKMGAEESVSESILWCLVVVSCPYVQGCSTSFPSPFLLYYTLNRLMKFCDRERKAHFSAKRLLISTRCLKHQKPVCTRMRIQPLYRSSRHQQAPYFNEQHIRQHVEKESPRRGVGHWQPDAVS